jgi:RNA polymerase sigma-70 factor, ECF subfamily
MAPLSLANRSGCVIMGERSTTAEWPGSVAGSVASDSLLQRVKAREPEAWERLVDLYGPQIYQWCRTSGLQAEDAADIGQEVFVAIAGGIAGFRCRWPGDTLRGWIWTVTRNKINDHFRRKKGRPLAQGGTAAQERLAQVADEDQGNSAIAPDATTDTSLEHRALAIVRDGIEERTWQAFYQLAVGGRAAREVAEELGLTPAAVYKAKYRVVRQVRQVLGDLPS